MSDLSDKTFLASFADSVLRTLGRRKGLGDFLIRLGAVKVEPTDTDGWKALLGELPLQGLKFEVWFDRFQGRRARKLWYGLSASDKPALVRFLGTLRRCVGGFHKIGESNIKSVHGRFYCLRRELRPDDFERPMFEHYRNRRAYFGFYHLDVPDSRSPASRRLATQIADFCCRVSFAFQEKNRRRRLDGSSRASGLVFDQQFRRFLDAVRARSGQDFRSFHEGLPSEWEGYKEALHRQGRLRLRSESWKPKDVGTGKILARVISAIEISERAGVKRNNLVAWSKRYGPRAVSHRALLESQRNRERIRELEGAFFKLYRSNRNEGATFERICELAGRRYDLLAYLFFLKDLERFMPISPSSFDQAFRLLHLDLTTSAQCSWNNYRRYIDALREVSRLLTHQAGLDWVRLIDAHSFCWMLARLQIPDQPFSARMPVPEQLGRIELSPAARKHASLKPGSDREAVNFEKLAKVRRELGALAEGIVIETEQQRLSEVGRNDLADRVQSVAEDHTLGYDVLSFESDGTPKHIEVKAARHASGKVSFYLSQNEWDRSRKLPNYHFYFVFAARTKRLSVRWIPANRLRKDFLRPVVHFVEFSAENVNHGTDSSR